MSSFLSPLAGRTSPPLSLVEMASGAVIATHLLPALDSATRRTGLLKHTSLPEGTAMIIAPTNAIHTWFMKFDIDVMFVARDGRVLKVCHAMRPWRMAVALRGFAVVELAAGTLFRLGVTRGGTLTLISSRQTA